METLSNGQAMPIWKDENGKTIACKEKIKVLKESLDEWLQNSQDVFEDAVLMGCEEKQVKDFLIHLIGDLENPYGK